MSQPNDGRPGNGVAAGARAQAGHSQGNAGPTPNVHLKQEDQHDSGLSRAPFHAVQNATNGSTMNGPMGLGRVGHIVELKGDIFEVVERAVTNLYPQLSTKAKQKLALGAHSFTTHMANSAAAKARIDELEKQLADSKTQLAEFENQFADSKTEKVSAAARVIVLEQQLAELEAKNKDQLAEMEAKNKVLAAKKRESEKQLVDLQTESDMNATKVKALELEKKVVATKVGKESDAAALRIHELEEQLLETTKKKNTQADKEQVKTSKDTDIEYLYNLPELASLNAEERSAEVRRMVALARKQEDFESSQAPGTKRQRTSESGR